MRVYITQHIAGLGLLMLLTTARAQAPWQDLADVQALAERFVRQQVQVNSGTVRIEAAAPEPRLRLPACARMSAFAPPGARWWGAASVGVRCEAPSIWSLYLPVTVRVWDQVLVAARTLPKGHLLTEQDLARQQGDITQLPPGAHLDPDQVIGRVTKAPIVGGSLLRADLLQAQALVTQGELVRIAYAGDGFQVQGQGRALSAAGLGESVSVKADSGRVIKGVVRAKGWIWVQ